jgi:hypothetical protein
MEKCTMSKAASGGSERNSAIAELEANPEQTVREVEQFRENLVSKLREVENDLESRVELSNIFSNVMIFSRLSPEHGKAEQLIAGSIVRLGERKDSKIFEEFVARHKGDEGVLGKVASYAETVDSRRERFFPEGDVSFHSSSDKVVFHHISEDVRDMQPRQTMPEILKPLGEYLFSDVAGINDLRDAMAHEGTHSWIAGNVSVPDRKPEDFRAAEECFCYLAGWECSRIVLESDHLVEGKTPHLETVAWLTKLLIERAKEEGLGRDWARKNAGKMYRERPEKPLKFVFKTSLKQKQREKISRYTEIIEEDLKPVFGELDAMLSDVEEKELEMGSQISYQRSRQIHDQVEWQSPERVEEELRSKLYNRARNQQMSHAGIDRRIDEVIRKEVELLEEYIEVLGNLENVLNLEEEIEEVEKVRDDLRSVMKEILRN